MKTTPLKRESRWPVPDDPGLWYTGRTFCLLTDWNGDVFIGMARCMSDDKFTLEMGEKIARGRAEKAMDMSRYRGHNQTVELYLRDGTVIKGDMSP